MGPRGHHTDTMRRGLLWAVGTTLQEGQGAWKSTPHHSCLPPRGASNAYTAKHGARQEGSLGDYGQGGQLRGEGAGREKGTAAEAPGPEDTPEAPEM